MRFSDTLWQSTEPIYKSILEHPFNTELAAGTLTPDKFAYYVQQDELYIKAYARALTLLAAKAPSSEMANELLSYSKDGILIEHMLHDHFFKTFHIEQTAEPQPACFSYSNFLLATTAVEPFDIGLAALLPCFWIYRQVGHFIAKTSVADNPYQLWIDTYTDIEYDKVVDRVIDMTNAVADKASDSIKAKMATVFVYSTRLEYNFWDAAYHLDTWHQ